MNSYKNSESVPLNSYTWIHILMNLYIHFTYEFTCKCSYIIISYMNSYNDYMNSYVYEFTYMNSHMNSYKVWLHMIFHTWTHIFYEFIYELGCAKVPDDSISYLLTPKRRAESGFNIPYSPIQLHSAWNGVWIAYFCPQAQAQAWPSFPSPFSESSALLNCKLEGLSFCGVPFLFHKR